MEHTTQIYKKSSSVIRVLKIFLVVCSYFLWEIICFLLPTLLWKFIKVKIYQAVMFVVNLNHSTSIGGRATGSYVPTQSNDPHPGEQKLRSCYLFFIDYPNTCLAALLVTLDSTARLYNFKRNLVQSISLIISNCTMCLVRFMHGIMACHFDIHNKRDETHILC